MRSKGLSAAMVALEGPPDLKTEPGQLIDPAAGYAAAKGFILKGTDVLVCQAGKTGLGAGKAHNVKAIGVDVAQYLTFPEAGSTLMTSVVKKKLWMFTNGRKKNSQDCKNKVALANRQIVFNPAVSLQPRP